MSGEDRTPEERALDAVQRHCERWGVAYRPDMVLNGKDGFHGEEAGDLLRAVAAELGIPAERLETASLGRWFPEEESASLLPFVLLGRALGFLEADDDPEPLTATALAGIMASLKDHPP